MIGVIERIEAGLASDTPSRVEWRTLLETALTEIKEIRHHHDEFVVAATIRMTDQNAEIARLLAAITCVVETFEKDEARGYRSRDRQFAIEILRRVMLPKDGT